MVDGKQLKINSICQLFKNNDDFGMIISYKYLEWFYLY
jgi:hypothetical protein